MGGRVASTSGGAREVDIGNSAKAARRHIVAAVLAATLTAAGCSTLPRIPYTESEAAAAKVAGLDDVRMFADAPASSFRFDSSLGLAERTAGKPLSYLALSGGGEDGAYGAGVLNGWTASGTRPVFTIVSGVSAGALIAPFAFLGPAYDGVLREIYTTGIGESLFDSPNLFSVVFGSGLFGNTRLRELVARYVDQDLIAAVAAAHAKGRRLLIITTNLDTQRAVIWDMGRIAASGSPKAIELFRDVLAASASIPVVFPPMLIGAEAGGRHFEEMHVDGAVIAPVFTLPEAFVLRNASLFRGPRLNIYILVNNKVEPDFQVVPNRTVEIAGRASSSSVLTVTRSVLFGTYRFAQRNHFGFNLTYVDKEIPPPKSVGFDTAYMRSLFDYGFEKARSPSLWVHRPPSQDRTPARPRDENVAGRTP
ncbi:MAG TPA: patatin-like phospholipase family protein [Xanthobacteraceae bacterium]|jgi:predicted acylesterase/phospholipase RssA|nr:patatin-like phospholipase family protein [Xanthobacteraceae bacterium]